MPKPESGDLEIQVSEKDNQKEVVVELNEHNEPIKKEAPKDEPKYVRLEDLQKLSQAINSNNGWASRKITSMEEKLEKLLSQGGPSSIPSKPSTGATAPVDEWEKKLQSDWKGTVEELAEIKFKALLDEKEKISKIQAEEHRKSRLLEENKLKVMQRHKDLDDPSSEKAQVFQAVLQENPDYLQDPFGPVLAMRDMEDRLREQGRYVDDSTKKIVEKEVTRQTRAGAAVVPQGTHSSGNKVVLTKDDREFCDINGIKYETYAQNKKILSGNGSLSL